MLFATSEEALASAIREDTIRNNLVNLSNDYLRKGNQERSERLLYLSTLRYGGMLDDLGDAMTLEAREYEARHAGIS